jgi:hypothetical protein
MINYFKLKGYALLSMFFLAGSYYSFSQTVLLSPTGDGGFETGATFTSNGWTTANGAPTARVWYDGTGQAGFTGTAAAFIGNNATTVGTSAAARLVHLYRSLNIPAGATNIQLTFKYKQAVSDNTFDFLKVYMSSATPVSGTAVASGLIITADPDGVTTYPTFTELTATIPNSYAGAANNLIFSFTANNTPPHAYGAIDDVSVTYTPAPACTGTPAAGTAVVSGMSVCTTDNFTLSLTGSEPASSIAYQWQSSPDGVSYTDIAGATTLTYTTTQSAHNFYRARVTCTPSTLSAFSTAVEVNFLPNCYCTASATNTNAIYEKISNVTLNDLNNSSTSVVGYENFTALSANVEKGVPQTVTVTASNSYEFDQAVIYIDYNRNGLFTDAGETIYTSEIFEGPYVATFSVPGSTTNGPTRMRIRFHDSSDGPNTAACGTATYGQVEDYTVNIICPVTIPAPTATNVSTCAGNTATLTAATIMSGATIEWYNAAAAGSLLASTASYTTPALGVTTSYWAAASLPGCPAGTRTEVVATIDPVNASLAPVNVNCNGGSDGSFTLGTIVCGTQPFTYSVNGGTYGAIPTNLAAGTYSVVIKDASANLSATNTIVITQPSSTVDNPTVTADVVCPGEVSAIVSASAIMNPLNIGTVTLQFSQAGQPAEVSGLEPDILLTPNIISSAILPALPAGAVVTLVELSVPNLTPLGESYGSDVGFGLTGAALSEFYGGIGAPDATAPFSFLTQFENASVNTAGGTINLHYYDLLDDNAGAPECNFPTGNFATLTINYTYPTTVGITWWDAATGGNQLGAANTLETVGTAILPNTTTPGVYEFFAQGQSGICKSAARTPVTVTVQTAPVPAITADGPATFCAGEDVVLTSSAATGNSWSNAATTQAITVTTAGIYSVTATYANGCVMSSAPTTVVVNALPAVPTITADGPLTFCAGNDVVLTSSAATGNSWSNAATTQAVTITASGIYTVTETNGSGCSATSAPITVTANPVVAPTITTNGPLTFCAGGTVTLTSSLASGNLWSTTQTAQIITVSTAGTYTVADNSGCGGTSAPVTVVVHALPAVPTITADGPLVFCSGGDVVLTSSAATGNSWSNAETTQAVTITASGTYTVTATNVNGCSATSAAAIVTANPVVAPTITASGPLSFCTGGSVTLTSSNISGNTWSTAETTAAITVSAAGTYTVTDNTGCGGTSAPVTVVVNTNPTAPVITANGPVSFCEGGDVTLTSSAATGNSWSTAATTSGITVSEAGTYTVTHTDANGCFAMSAPMTVVVNEIPTVNAGADISVCAGEPVVLTASGTGTFTWNNGVSQATPFTPTTTASYTVTVSNGSCTNTDVVQVTVIPVPVAVATLSNAATLVGTPAGQAAYQWYNCSNSQPIAGATSATYVATANGSYSVLVTNASGCNDMSECIAVTTLGVGEQTADLPISLYPNPTNRQVTLSLGAILSADVTVYDAQGKRISTLDDVHDGAVIDLGRFETGVYVIHVATEQGVHITRVVKN